MLAIEYSNVEKIKYKQYKMKTIINCKSYKELF